MSFSVGIVGLPNVGKSTLFKALTKKPVDIAPYPFTTIRPNLGVVQVSDERLEKIAEIIKPEKITPTVIEFIDIAGLVKDAHKGEGLGNQFLAEIRNCDAVLEIIRDFEDPKAENILGETRPEERIETIKTEFLMKDLETLENGIGKMESDKKTGAQKTLKKFELLEKLKTAVSQGEPISEIKLTDEEKSEIKEYQFLTQKPVIYLLNSDKSARESLTGFAHLNLNLKEEEDISELSEKERKELGINSQLAQLIKNCYNVLDLITFFTVAGGKETRAWTLKKGLKAPEAAGIVHSDFKEKFIRAEVVSWERLLKAGSWTKAKESGKIAFVGKDYVVQDGDVIEFKI